MVSRVDVSADVLAGTALFAELSGADRAALAVCLQGRRYAAGEVVFREGEPGATLLLVAEGTFVASARRADGKQETLNRIGVGEVAGEMAFLDPAPRSATVTSEAGGVAYELGHDAMGALRARCPEAVGAIVSAVLRDVTIRLERLDDRIELELARHARGRLDTSPRGGAR